jgi:hypothetical protein
MRLPIEEADEIGRMAHVLRPDTSDEGAVRNEAVPTLAHRGAAEHGDDVGVDAKEDL